MLKVIKYFMLHFAFFTVLSAQKLVTYSITPGKRYDQLKITMLNDTEQVLITAGYSYRNRPTEVYFGLMEGDSIWYIDYFGDQFRARDFYCKEDIPREFKTPTCHLTRDKIYPGKSYDLTFNFHLNDNPLNEKVDFAMRLFDTENQRGWVYLFPLNYKGDVRKYPINRFLQCAVY